MPDPIDDGSDSKSRNELRRHRENFNRADASHAVSFYLSRWIPSRTHTSSLLDGLMVVIGAVMLVGLAIAFIIAWFVK
jgi:hypothetical protein